MQAPRRSTAPTAAALLVFLAAFLFAACGGDDDLEAASEQLAESREAVEQARALVRERETEARAADEALAQARARLDEAEEELAAAEQKVAKRADDAVLFRKVQRRLLDAEALRGVAISAKVQQRVVTLEGTVPRKELSTRAAEIAANTAGVARVDNRISVQVAAGSGKE